MSYETEIGEVEAPAWAELYEFTIGSVVNRYTSHDEPVEHNLVTWLPRTINRKNFDEEAKVGPIRLTLMLPLDEVMIGIVANAPVEPIQVVITRVILDTGDEYEIFSGEVVDVSIKDNIAEATIEPGSEIFKSEFPSFAYQARCQWMLFDDGCGLNEADYRVEGAVTLSDGGRKLSSAIFATYPDGHFTLGYVRFQNDIRLVTYHEGADLTIQAPFDTRLVDGKVVRAYPGCDKSGGTCDVKFGNYPRFTGFRNVPSRNPVIWGLEE